MMDLTSIVYVLLTLVLALCTCWALLMPFLDGATDKGTIESLAQRAEERERLFRELEDLEIDSKTGKVEAVFYQTEHTRLLKKIATIDSMEKR